MEPTTQERKYIDVSEFRKIGYLQEANRLFFHPHGLALEVKIQDDEESFRKWLTEWFDSVPDGPDHIDVALALLAEFGIKPGGESLSGVWDDRDDAEGICFGDPVDTDKIDAVAAERRSHRIAREVLFACDSDVQPPGWRLER